MRPFQASGDFALDSDGLNMHLVVSWTLPTRVILIVLVIVIVIIGYYLYLFARYD